MRNFSMLASSAAIVAALSGCGDPSTTRDERDTEATEGDQFAVFDRAPPASVPGLDAAYAVLDDGVGQAAFVAFYSGSRFFAGGVKQVSPQHFQMGGVVGDYVETNGVVTPHAVKRSCPKPAAARESRIVRQTAPDQLVLSTDSATYVLPRLAVSGQPAHPNGYVVEWGCFDRAMRFTPHAWIPAG